MRWAVAAAVIAGAVAAAAGLGVRSSHGGRLTGDEPHYLLTAVSLAEDRSLDLRDEFAARRYRPFHELPLRPQGIVGDRPLLAPHDPLLPALLALPAAAGGWLGAKLLLVAVNAALAGLLVWTAVRRFGVAPRTAGVAAGVFAASAPFAVYGSQVYPELPAAAAVAVGIAALTGPLRAGGLALLSAAVVALPWLSVKYAPVAGALAVLGCIRIWRAGGRRTAAAWAGLLGVAGLAFVAAHLAWYGGVTAYAAGHHFVEGGEFSVAGSRPDLWGRSVRLVGLLVDREFGLAAWQPAWLLGVPAVAALVRRRPPGWSAVALPLGAGWLVATFVALTMHGWWFPGRQTVVVLPALVLAVACWADASVRRLAVLAVAGGVGVAAYLWLAAEGTAGRLTWAVDFASTSNPVFAAWTSALPDYRAATARTWALHAVWATVLVAAVWMAARGRSPVHGSASRPSPRRVRGRVADLWTVPVHGSASRGPSGGVPARDADP